jgi:anthranilate/para-aminobenzoate synthase component II
MILMLDNYDSFTYNRAAYSAARPVRSAHRRGDTGPRQIESRS